MSYLWPISKYVNNQHKLQNIPNMQNMLNWQNIQNMPNMLHNAIYAKFAAALNYKDL